MRIRHFVCGSVGCLFRGACGRSAGCRSPTYVPAVTPFNWSGVYFGAQGGYGWGSTSQSFANGAPSGNSDPQGWLGGVYLGFNWQVNNVVLGLEGDFEGADINGSFTRNSGIDVGRFRRHELGCLDPRPPGHGRSTVRSSTHGRRRLCRV